MTLPIPLQSAIAEWLGLARSRGGGNRGGSDALSTIYRAGGHSRDVDLASYLVARLPATYAAVIRVLAELGRRRPDFVPVSLLDAGCGPGTAAWAACALWSGLRQVTLLDSVPAMIELAAALAQHGPPALAASRRIMAQVGRLPQDVAADLVVASYVLAESPARAASAAALDLWAASRSVLVIVEPGTPQGFSRLRAAREVLLAEGAVPVAPCPHDGACPVMGHDWCHFRVRLPRSRAHMHAKGATVPFEDEPFSYLVMAREGHATGGARVLAAPRQSKPGIDLKLCHEGRIEIRHIARRQGTAHRHASKLGWGDLVFSGPVEEKEL